MQKEEINFTGVFHLYLTFKDEPYYVFKNTQQYLISCAEQPKLITKDDPRDFVNISAEIEAECDEGIILTNVKWNKI